MKTTVEISDDLALSLKDELKKSGLSMRTALEEALRNWLERKKAEERRSRIDPGVGVFGGNGMTPEIEGKSWDEIRDLVYPEGR